MDENEYLRWIFDVIDGWDYSCMLKQLHTIEFYSDIWLDENLIDDVESFRDRMGRDYDGPRGGPTVLEIFVVLADKCEDKIMHNPDFGNRTSDWFWAMMDNLGLGRYDDVHYNSNSSEKVSDIIDIFLEKDYEYDGTCGGAFPCKDPPKDMRNTALWEQLNYWLNENYYDEFREGVYDL